MKKPVVFTITHRWILLLLSSNAVMNIIPVTTAMQKKQGTSHRFGVKLNLMKKLFYAVFVKTK
jgi:hypothetical protein